MKRTIVSAAVLALMTGGIGSALADPPADKGPGPNGKNNYGLCKAYFAGSDNGKENKRDKGPFPALEAEAGDVDGDGDTDENDVAAFCAEQTPGGKG